MLIASIALLFACIILLVDTQVIVLILLSILLACLTLFIVTWMYVKRAYPSPSKGVVGFFHPFADGGGGGERVLWAAVQALQRSHPRIKIVIYCGSGSTPSSLSQQASTRFNLTIRPSFSVVELPSKDLLLPERYPRFTMVGQALGSVIVAAQGLKQQVPEVWVDTTGWAFPYPLVRLAGGRVAAYVHYPTISTDMLEGVRQRQATFNNDGDVAGSWLKSSVKLVYYKVFAVVYGAVGGCSQVTMVNSNWTRAHIEQLWLSKWPPAVVYPPCDTAALRALPLDRKLKRLYIVSVAQFRPEKNHELQLRAFAAARNRAMHLTDPVAADAVLSARFQLVGGCRGPDDEARLHHLQDLAQELGLEDAVDFQINVPFDQLRALLGDAVAGLHTMRDEHFGISVVEYMAAGVVPVVHNSGGPREDIVVPEGGQITGYRCTTMNEYRDALVEVLGMDQGARLKLTAAARKRALMFSDQRFQDEFLACLEKVLPS